jgi:hypothetical protein
MAKLFELLDKYNQLFPNAETPLNMMIAFGENQVIEFMKQSIEAGEPLEFEDIENNGEIVLDGMIVRIGDKIVS